MEIRDVDFRDVPLRIQDPGAMTLIFVVSDLDELLSRVRSHGGEIVTSGGSALAIANAGRAVLVRDIDGRPIELREPAAVNSNAAAAVTSMRISIAVEDLQGTLEIYRDVLGFSVVDENPFVPDEKLHALTGLSGAEFRRRTVLAPGSSLPIEFVEYRNVDRHSLAMRIQDRGAARLQVRADDVEALVAKMKDAGLRVVSKGGGPVPIPPNFMGALHACCAKHIEAAPGRIVCCGYSPAASCLRSSAISGLFARPGAVTISSGVRPSASTTSRLAPRSARSLMKPPLPLRAARCIGT
jgi:catechol 2,3-dioxygenase-like lactoylglutathione lyase family enzyme